MLIAIRLQMPSLSLTSLSSNIPAVSSNITTRFWPNIGTSRAKASSGSGLRRRPKNSSAMPPARRCRPCRRPRLLWSALGLQDGLCQNLIPPSHAHLSRAEFSKHIWISKPYAYTYTACLPHAHSMQQPNTSGDAPQPEQGDDSGAGPSDPLRALKASTTAAMTEFRLVYPNTSLQTICMSTTQNSTCAHNHVYVYPCCMHA